MTSDDKVTLGQYAAVLTLLAVLVVTLFTIRPNPDDWGSAWTRGHWKCHGDTLEVRPHGGGVLIYDQADMCR